MMAESKLDDPMKTPPTQNNVTVELCPDCDGEGGRMVDSLGQPYWADCTTCNGFGYKREVKS